MITHLVSFFSEEINLLGVNELRNCWQLSVIFAPSVYKKRDVHGMSSRPSGNVRMVRISKIQTVSKTSKRGYSLQISPIMKTKDKIGNVISAGLPREELHTDHTSSSILIFVV